MDFRNSENNGKLGKQGESRQATTASSEAFKQITIDSLEIRVNDPWVRKIPMDVLIPHQLEVIANSKRTMTSSKLLDTAENILEYIQELQNLANMELPGHKKSIQGHSRHPGTLEEQNKRKENGCVQLSSLLGTFDCLLQRIISAKFDDENFQSLQTFLHNVWTCHVEGKVEFSDTAVQCFLDAHPEYLEKSIIKHIKERNPKTLVALCKKNSYTFQSIFKLLSQMYHDSKRHCRIMHFSEQFLEALEDEFIASSECNIENESRYGIDAYISMYPEEFHPLLWFIAQFQDESVFHFDKTVSEENSIVQVELLEGIEDLIRGRKSNKDLELRAFFLASNRTTIYVITSANQAGKITLGNCPFLWAFINEID